MTASGDRRIARYARLGTWLIRLLGATWRIRRIGDDVYRGMQARGEPFILALWHGQMLPLLYAHRGDGTAIVISEHRDGEIIARVASNLGFALVRGSSSRGAARALVGIIRALQSGQGIAITPDGPRGPARSVAPGAMIAAQRSGAPIITIYAHVTRAWTLKSWDAFLIPKPFASITIAYGPPSSPPVADAREAADSGAWLRDRMAQAEAAARA
jgi:lysophospholipid acyltransferase (LPLAT)-like uncharacterized protein